MRGDVLHNLNLCEAGPAQSIHAVRGTKKSYAYLQLEMENDHSGELID